MNDWYSFPLIPWKIILSFGLLCCILLFVALCFTIYQLYYNNNKTAISIHRSTCIKALSWITLIFFFSAQIFNHLYVIYTKLPNGIHNKYTESLWSGYNILWSFSYTFIYCLFFQTLRELKKQYGLKISTIQEIVFIILTVILLLDQLLISLSSLMLSWRQWSWITFNTVYFPALIIEISTDLILNAFIVYMYISKIKEMSINQQMNEIDGLNQIKKYFKLTLLTVISTSIFTVSEIILSESINYATKTGSFQFYYIAYMIYFILGNVDSMVSTIYVLLIFSIAKDWNKCCPNTASEVSEAINSSVVHIVKFICSTITSSNSSGGRTANTHRYTIDESEINKFCHIGCKEQQKECGFKEKYTNIDLEILKGNHIIEQQENMESDVNQVNHTDIEDNVHIDDKQNMIYVDGLDKMDGLYNKDSINPERVGLCAPDCDGSGGHQKEERRLSANKRRRNYVKNKMLKENTFNKML